VRIGFFRRSQGQQADGLYELAKILGHSNIKMTERYAKLARQHIAKTGSTAREIWKLLELKNADLPNIAG
jgi:hypothetical protein